MRSLQKDVSNFQSSCKTVRGSALAKAGHSVLHIDENAYYGSNQATLSLHELDAWWKAKELAGGRPQDLDSPELPQSLLKQSRSYNLSLCPTLVPAVSPFVEALVRSGVAKYTGFKLLDAVAIYSQDGFKRTAAAKEEIFNDPTLSLVDKRKLMKFLMFAAGDFESSNLIKGGLYMASASKLADPVLSRP